MKHSTGGHPVDRLELVILIGLQGSGKSTFYRAFFAGTHAWVRKDHYRNNRNPSWRQRQLLEEFLQAGRSVVVDNTNPAKADRAAPIDLGHSFGATVIGYYLAVPLAECLERNRQRTGKARVPDVALYVTLKKLERPTMAEGFDQLFWVRPLDDGRFEIRAWQEDGVDDETR
jgi:predicted kinase